MSSASRFGSDSTTDRPIDPRAPTDRVASAVRFAGFWTAVLLPFVLVAVLATGFAHRAPVLVGGLVLCNLLGLVAGRDYNRSPDG